MSLIMWRNITRGLSTIHSRFIKRVNWHSRQHSGTTTGVLPEIEAMQDEMMRWRREFHRHPELAFQEKRTANTIVDLLHSFGSISVSRFASTGVVGVLEGTKPSLKHRRIGLRADIDALPMEELNEFEHKSVVRGKFHGCGHDGHTSILLGVAKYLSSHKSEFTGTVRFIFQPGEESAGGGRVMVEEGLFSKFPCDEIYALHNWPMIAKGKVAIHRGPVMANENDFRISILGTGGHAAMPQITVDPIMIGSHVVNAIQSLVSRSTNPMNPVVISVTSFQSGNAYNVIPSQAILKGTIRSFNNKVRQEVSIQLENLVKQIASSFGGSAEVEIYRGYPATINSDKQVDRARSAAKRAIGQSNVLTESEVEPSMASEDFSYMLNEVPGCYFWIGSDTPVMVHHPNYDFDDTIMPLAVQIFVNIVKEEVF